MMRKQQPNNQIAMPSDLKRVNRQKILEVFRSGETLTAAGTGDVTVSGATYSSLNKWVTP